VRPRDTLNLVRDIEAHIRGHNVADHRMWASPGMGTVSTRWSYSANDPAAIAKMVALHADLIGLASHTVVTAAPIDVKRRIDIWGAEPDTLDVMRELKHEFDPSRVLNPGRFAGRL
jgi:glycolate oxidase FAD binding subunit